jgi:hypothetical protein
MDTRDIDYIVIDLKTSRHVYEISPNVTGKCLVAHVKAARGFFYFQRGVFLVFIVHALFLFAWAMLPIHNALFVRVLSIASAFAITRMMLWDWPLKMIMAMIASLSVYCYNTPDIPDTIDDEAIPWIDAMRLAPRHFFLDRIDHVVVMRSGMCVAKIKMGNNITGKSLFLELGLNWQVFWMSRIALYLSFAAAIAPVLRYGMTQ